MDFHTALIPSSFQPIAEKVINGNRITDEEGLLLYEKADTGFLGMLAEFVNQRKSGGAVYFIRNFHLEPTNICVNKCRFCSYSHHFNKDTWDLSVEEMLETVKKQDKSVREVHITGAVHPKKDLFYYADLFSRIRLIRDDLHIKALSAVELEYIFDKANDTIQ